MLTSHIFMIPVDSRPHVLFESGFCIQCWPKRITAAPSGHISYMKHHIKWLLILFFQLLYHFHSHFLPVWQWSVSVHIGNYTHTPFSRFWCCLEITNFAVVVRRLAVVIKHGVIRHGFS